MLGEPRPACHRSAAATKAASVPLPPFPDKTHSPVQRVHMVRTPQFRRSSKGASSDAPHRGNPQSPNRPHRNNAAVPLRRTAGDGLERVAYPGPRPVRPFSPLRGACESLTHYNVVE